MKLLIQNFLLFQVGWLACVLGGASEHAWIGVAAVSVIIAIHLKFAKVARPELYLIGFAIIIGGIWDGLLTYTGLLQFENGIYIDGMAPYWIIAMWALFATTLNVSMRWMKGKTMLAAAFGLIGGPLAYFAGHKLGAVEFTNLMQTMLAIGIGWAVIMPALMYLADRYNGYDLATEEVKA